MTSPLKTRPDLVVLPDSSSPAARSLEKRRLRKHQVLNIIRQSGPISRRDIVDISGFNLPSVSSFVQESLDEHLVFEEKSKTSRLGRHSKLVTLNPQAACVVGIDAGKRLTTGVAVSLGGTILARIEEDTPESESAEELAKRLVRLGENLYVSQASMLPPLAGIGVALPGLVGEPERPAGPASNGAAATHAGGGTDERQIRHSLEERFGVPVFLDNDARMSALGSMWFGTGRDLNTFAVINIGFGLGMGIVIDKKLFRGAMGFSGELGHIPLGDAGVPWYTGIERGLENVASGAGIARLGRLAGLNFRDASEIAEMASQGDREATEVIERFALHLAYGIATVISLFNPEAVILTGRVCRSNALFMPMVEKNLERLVLPAVRPRTRLIISQQRENESTLGAAAIVLHHIFMTSHVNLEQVL
ncbi:MAG: ROK family protein [Sumerlaeia bacterium]